MFWSSTFEQTHGLQSFQTVNLRVSIAVDRPVMREVCLGLCQTFMMELLQFRYRNIKPALKAFQYKSLAINLL